ncbi:MAG TPA: hypothetical protein VJ385_04330 [Fibrobacteria bacterium]|nr:hypothetical protein [Fibrobacteria bacterium]
MMRRIVLSAAAVSLSAGFLFAEAGPQYRDTKSQALGRTGVASSMGAPSLFLNPAALGKDGPGAAGLSTDLGVNSVLLDYAAWAADNYRYLDKPDSMLTKIGPVDNKWAPFSQSFLLYGNYQGIALAVLSDTRYNLTLSKAVVTPVIGVGALSDLVLTAGRGFRIEDGYRFGFALKYLYRLSYDDRLVGTTENDFYVAKRTLQRPGKGFFDNLSKLGVAADLAETRQGVGLNLGAEKDIDENWTVGLSTLDFPTILDQNFLRPEIDLGLSYHRNLDLVPDLGNRVLVNLDWQRVLIPGTPWFKQLKAGAAVEGYMKKRQVAYLGAGLNDGYPTFGVRFGYIVYLSYVYVAEEIGTYPGQEKLSFHKIVLQAEI